MDGGRYHEKSGSISSKPTKRVLCLLWLARSRVELCFTISASLHSLRSVSTKSSSQASHAQRLNEDLGCHAAPSLLSTLLAPDPLPPCFISPISHVHSVNFSISILLLALVCWWPIHHVRDVDDPNRPGRNPVHPIDTSVTFA